MSGHKQWQSMAKICKQNEEAKMTIRKMFISLCVVCLCGCFFFQQELLLLANLYVRSDCGNILDDFIIAFTAPL